MNIIDSGTLDYAGIAGSNRAVATFPSVTTLGDDSLICTYRIGSGKDAPDANVEFRRSFDSGRTWTPPVTPFSNVIRGLRGEVRCAYVTPLSKAHLFVCALWSDRETYPGKPLFNPDTEGCLPMSLLVAGSHDGGANWTPWRIVSTPDDVGPPSLTSPALLLPDGRLVISIETNKQYFDTSTWRQRVVYVYSKDRGLTWSAPSTVCEDPNHRIFYWDQRAAVTPDGRIVTFSWVYDRQLSSYLNILQRSSSDGGKTWSTPTDLGFADQPSRPAILPDGRIVLTWVDRYGSQSIRARIARSIDDPFLEETEVVLYNHKNPSGGHIHDTAQLLTDMGMWTYGQPYAEVLPNGDVLVVFYAGTNEVMTVHWCRLSV